MANVWAAEWRWIQKIQQSLEKPSNQEGSQIALWEYKPRTLSNINQTKKEKEKKKFSRVQAMVCLALSQSQL